MNDILPSTEWAADDMRPALTLILRRLDKTFSKIHKKASIRRNTNWVAASNLLKGVYETLSKCPYIAHFQYLKTLLNTCQVNVERISSIGGFASIYFNLNEFLILINCRQLFRP